VRKSQSEIDKVKEDYKLISELYHNASILLNKEHGKVEIKKDKFDVISENNIKSVVDVLLTSDLDARFDTLIGLKKKIAKLRREDDQGTKPTLNTTKLNVPKSKIK